MLSHVKILDLRDSTKAKAKKLPIHYHETILYFNDKPKLVILFSSYIYFEEYKYSQGVIKWFLTVRVLICKNI